MLGGHDSSCDLPLSRGRGGIADGTVEVSFVLARALSFSASKSPVDRARVGDMGTTGSDAGFVGAEF